MTLPTEEKQTTPILRIDAFGSKTSVAATITLLPEKIVIIKPVITLPAEEKHTTRIMGKDATDIKSTEAAPITLHSQKAESCKHEISSLQEKAGVSKIPNLNTPKRTPKRPTQKPTTKPTVTDPMTKEKAIIPAIVLIFNGNTDNIYKVFLPEKVISSATRLLTSSYHFPYLFLLIFNTRFCSF